MIWGAVLAWFLVNAVLAFDAGEISTLFIPHLDALFLVSFVALGRKFGSRAGRVSAVIAGSALVLSLVFRVADELVPHFFGRPLILRHDVWLLPNLYDLVFDSLGGIRGSLLVAFVAVGLVVTIYAGGRSLGIASRPLTTPIRLGSFFIIAGALCLWFGSFDSHLVSATEGIADAYSFYGNRGDIDRKLEALSVSALDYPTDLERLSGADVMIFFVESYGRVLWREPSYRERFEPFLREYDDKLRRAGFHVASHFTASPVKGGGSWLAHATFQAGFDCDNTVCYERILQSGVVPLSSYFRKAGYRTISVLPAVDVEPSEWPEGEYFQFDEHFWHNEVDYRGESVGWSPVPDQFAIRALHERRLSGAPEKPPLFVEVSLTSSHAPFDWLPPYIEDTVSLDAMALRYDKSAWRRFDNGFKRLREAAEGYTATIKYSLRSVLDYVVDISERPTLVIILGDHQPISTIKGVGGRQVPVHVLSRDKVLVDAFVELGFRRGLFATGGSRMRLGGMLELILEAGSGAAP